MYAYLLLQSSCLIYLCEMIKYMVVYSFSLVGVSLKGAIKNGGKYEGVNNFPTASERWTRWQHERKNKHSVVNT